MDRVARHTDSIPRSPASPVLRFPIKSPLSTEPGLIGDHARMIERLILNKPNAIRWCADAEDATAFAEHIGSTIDAVADYLTKALAHIDDHLPAGSLPFRNMVATVRSLKEDILGPIEHAAEDMMEG